MKIHIDKLRIHAHHGVLPQERTVGAEFRISLTADVRVEESAYLQDQLQGTVNYADIISVVRQEMAISSNLLEHVAHRMAHRLLQDFPLLTSVQVRIDKVAAPIDGILCDALGVETTLNR